MFAGVFLTDILKNLPIEQETKDGKHYHESTSSSNTASSSFRAHHHCQCWTGILFLKVFPPDPVGQSCPSHIHILYFLWDLYSIHSPPLFADLDNFNEHGATRRLKF